jgi:hypothetical protein
MRRLASFLALSAWERGVFLRALVLLPRTALRIRRHGLRGAQAPLASSAPTGAMPSADAQSLARRIAWLVDAAARRGLFRASCLPRSLTLQRLLQERGIASELRVGVRKHAGRLEAHAWIECHGAPLLESAQVHERFAAFDQAVAPSAGAPR